MDNIDLKLTRNNGIYDLTIKDGDYESIESFDTALIMTIFGERRANESNQPINQNRRGWWGNIVLDQEGFEYGSLLWTFYQTRLNTDTKNLLQSKLFEAIEWFIIDGLLVNAEVNSEIINNNIKFTITLFRSNNNVESRSFKLWDNTGGNQI